MPRSLVLLSGGILLAWSLQADVVFDDTAQAPGGADMVDSISGVGPLYASFSTEGTGGMLSQVALFLEGDSTSSGGFSVGLYNDAINGGSDVPGSLNTLLADVEDASLTSDYSLLNVSLAAYPMILPDTRYWIGLAALPGGTSGEWAWTFDLSGIGVAGEFYSNANGTFPNAGGPYQMAVDPVMPEASTILCAGIMFAALAVFRFVCTTTNSAHNA